jgi:hypothetical protein
MLRATTPAINEITDRDRADMFALMQATYEPVNRALFERDLGTKHHAVMLWKNGCLQGFSTLSFLDLEIDSRPFTVVFSGDTVVHQSHRNSLVLPTAWCRLMADRMALNPNTPVYWLLTSKGYKTYRYLPVFFCDYFPRPGRSMSELERRIAREACAQLKLAPVDLERWLIPAQKGSQRLRPGVAEITPGRRSDPHIAFFNRVNPGHAQGDELLCLVRFSKANMRPRLWKRMMEASRCP